MCVDVSVLCCCSWGRRSLFFVFVVVVVVVVVVVIVVVVSYDYSSLGGGRVWDSECSAFAGLGDWG